MPEISVIVPLYNKARYIARALQSVLAQTFEDFELLVVDDGSTDEGPAIVARHNDSRVTLIRQENVGPGGARNNGVRASSGEIVTFLDADDEWLPEYLERAHSIFTDHPDVAFAVLGHYYGPDKVIRSHLYEALRDGEGPFRASSDWSAVSLRHAVGACHTSSTAIRRSAFDRQGGYFDRVRCTYGEDHYLFLLLMLCEQGYVDPRPSTWFHTEASELGRNRTSPAPPEPAVLYPERLRADCPQTLRPLLERMLSREAVLSAKRLMYAGKPAEARALLKRYPYNIGLGRELALDRLSIRVPVRWFIREHFPVLFRSLARAMRR